MGGASINNELRKDCNESFSWKSWSKTGGGKGSKDERIGQVLRGIMTVEDQVGGKILWSVQNGTSSSLVIDERIILDWILKKQLLMW